MQVDPVKPSLKAPETHHLKLNFDEVLSRFAFNFYLRRYIKGGTDVTIHGTGFVRTGREVCRFGGGPHGGEVDEVPAKVLTNTKLLCESPHRLFPGGAGQVEISGARVESACFQLFQLKYEATAFKFCIQFHLHRPTLAWRCRCRLNHVESA